MDVTVWSFIIGAAFIFVAILGGGFEAKEVKIPVLNFWARIISFSFGIVLIVVGLVPALSGYLKREQTPTPPLFGSTDKATSDRGQPTPRPPPSEQFGVALMASSNIYVAQETLVKAKSVAPEGSKIQIYKRMNSLWATVVIYSDNSVALADLSKYIKNPDWRDAYVVSLENWCPKPAQLDLVYQSPIGKLSTLDCHL